MAQIGAPIPPAEQVGKPSNMRTKICVRVAQMGAPISPAEQFVIQIIDSLLVRPFTRLRIQLVTTHRLQKRTKNDHDAAVISDTTSTNGATANLKALNYVIKPLGYNGILGIWSSERQYTVRAKLSRSRACSLDTYYRDKTISK